MVPEERRALPTYFSVYFTAPSSHQSSQIRPQLPSPCRVPLTPRFMPRQFHETSLPRRLPRTWIGWRRPPSFKFPHRHRSRKLLPPDPRPRFRVFAPFAVPVRWVLAHWRAFRVVGVKLMHPAPCVRLFTSSKPVFGVALAVRGVEMLVASVEADRDEYGDKEEDGGKNSCSDYDACAKTVRLIRVGSGEGAWRCSVER